jgi:hypothetical protein
MRGGRASGDARYSPWHGTRTSAVGSATVVTSGMTGSEQSFAAFCLDARPVWSQRISGARRAIAMGSSSRGDAGARDERSARLWTARFGR